MAVVSPTTLAISQLKLTGQVGETSFYEAAAVDVPPFGAFELAIEIDDVLLAESHVTMLEGLVRALEADKDALFETVFQDYLRAAENEEWMDLCEMPSHLRRADLPAWISARRVFVRDMLGEDPQARVYLYPKWDEEHCLFFERVGDRWVRRDC